MTNTERIQANNIQLRETIELAEALPEAAVKEPIIESLEVAENGIYAVPDGVDGYSPVHVNVDGSGRDDMWIEKTVSGEYSNNRVTSTEIGTFAYCSDLTKVSLPHVTNAAMYAFYYCISLNDVNLPNVTSAESYAFARCTSLTAIDLPLLTSAGTQAFAYTQLSKIYFPLLKTLGTYTFSYISVPHTIHLPSLTIAPNSCMRDNTGVTRIELDVCSKIDLLAFYHCTKLGTLILRKSDTICTLSNVNALSGTPIASGTGYVYVPAALVDSYKAATNWSTYAAQIRAIEDYTVDGTITGELDETKIET